MAADEKLFETVIRDNDHVLHKFLPPQSEAFEHYDLEERRHNMSALCKIVVFIYHIFSPCEN